MGLIGGYRFDGILCGCCRRDDEEEKEQRGVAEDEEWRGMGGFCLGVDDVLAKGFASSNLHHLLEFDRLRRTYVGAWKKARQRLGMKER